MLRLACQMLVLAKRMRSIGNGLVVTYVLPYCGMVLPALHMVCKARITKLRYEVTRDRNFGRAAVAYFLDISTRSLKHQ